MQEFYINKGAQLPELRMGLIYDGRHDFNKFYDAIQNADITFTMTNIDTNIIKIANAPCYIKKREGTACVDEYVICYKWKQRDTNEKGNFKGEINIDFQPLKSDSETFPIGNLIVPIREELMITIR